ALGGLGGFRRFGGAAPGIPARRRWLRRTAGVAALGPATIGRVALVGVARCRRGLEGHFAAVLDGAVGDQGVDVLIIIVETLGMVEDEIAVDQVVEDERAFLGLAIVFGVVLDLDVIVIALIHPGVVICLGIGSALLLADAPVQADLLEGR